MKTRTATLCIFVSALLSATVHAEDSDTDRKHPVAFVKDSVITVKIKSKLAHQKMRSLTHVHVDTDSAGVVELSGKVRSQKEADKAVAIAKETEGVKDVTNKLEIGK